MTDQMPPDMPELMLDSFTVPVRLLVGPQGRLLLPTEAEIRARSADQIDALEVDLADRPDELRAERVKAEALRDKQIAVYKELEDKRGGDIRTYTFRFRVAKGRDVEAAERTAALPVPREGEPEPELAKTPVRLRPAYRETLAQSTLTGHDWPDWDGKFEDLDNDVRDHVLAQVARRIYFSQDVRSFF